ncbi:hypothetical protein REG_0752 [Candidatus Regiella insecticola LSR1]|uniref:Uncharacterized protein n=1 Tax=Candidatus Regiella insecticola LSR1 TaxID=663321 RepID=E0WS31_9ENTR|nr:hypothetical protein REG_0752 [Candidatus Regiella insecticola LSR1]
MGIFCLVYMFFCGKEILSLCDGLQEEYGNKKKGQKKYARVHK